MDRSHSLCTYTVIHCSVVTVIAADIATAVDSFHHITTATAVAVDVFDGRCSVGTPLTISTAAAPSDIATSEVTGKMRCELAVPGELESEPCIHSRPLLAALH